MGQERSCYAAYVRAATSRMGWGWVGWGKTVQVTLHMYVLPRHAWGGVGWGGVRTFHVTLPAATWWGWGGVAWGNNFHAALLMYVQTIDRVWFNLKSWLPPKLRAVEKKVGHHFLNKGVNRMIQQWIWRQSVCLALPQG